MTRELYIIDGHSQMYRAYYAPFRDLTSPTGEPTRATYVFCQMLLRFLADRRPDYLAMAIDGPAHMLRRRAEYAEYKVTRKPAPEDFHPQVERILQIVRAAEVPVLEAEGYEADDLMATLAERFASDELHVVLVSRDKDLDQLVGPNVTLYDPMKDEVLDASAIEATKGYSPDKAVEIQTLTGDTTDNVPGIPGIGPKTAAKLIARYGSADEVLRHADELTPKLRENVLASREQIPLTRKLVTLDRAAPLDVKLESMRFEGLHSDVLRPIFTELGFNRLLDQLGAAGRFAEEPETVQVVADKQTTASDYQYQCIDTTEKLIALVEQLRGVRKLAVDTETDSVLPMWASLVGISLAWEAGEAAYLPVRGPLGATVLDLDLVRTHLQPALADESSEKIGHNLKYDLIVLRNAGLELRGPMFDTMIAAHVLDSTRPTYKMDALSAELLGHHCIPIEDLIGRGRNQTTMDTVPIDHVSTYAAEDADVTYRLAEVLRAKLSEEGLTPLMADLEMPLLPVIAEMEMRGVRVDPQELKRQETVLGAQADKLRDRIIELAKRPFNVDSPKQLALVLFEDLGLPVLKRKKTGPSTDSSVLEQLAIQHELPGLVLDYRKLTKLLGTYLKALTSRIHPKTHRVHTSFHQAGTATGRLSSSDPNLQNIPVRTEEGKQIRSAFVADEGCALVSADYSQVELRVLAHLCEDPTLLAAFRADQDIHRIVAAEVFGVAPEDVTPEQRARAKTVNFGIVYGQTAFGLSISLRIPRREAADFIADYRKRFPQIDDFLQACTRAAKDNGYVETLFGRRRSIGEIDSRNPQRRAAAERLAINSVVQGSAADLIKQAMVNIDARILREKRPSRMLLQIHDELVFEVPQDSLDEEREMIATEMTGAIKLRIPLKVDIGAGPNWMQAK
jgi:DNA polymerase I